MYTQLQIIEMAKGIAEYMGMKDSLLNDALLPLSGDEYFTIVLEDENKKYPLSSIAIGVPDEEDLTQIDGKIKFKDRVVDGAVFQLYGYKILRRKEDTNILTLEDFSDGNTIYKILYDFNLNGLAIVIPSNVILLFEGGSLSNGSVLFTNTDIISAPILIFKDSLEVSGTIKLTIELEWFIEDTSLESYVQILKAFNLASNGGNTILGNSSSYSFGNNTLSFYSNTRLDLKKDTVFNFLLQEDKDAITFIANISSNINPLVTSKLILNRSLYIKGDTTTRLGNGLGFNSVSATILLSNLDINNIKILYFNAGLRLPVGNFYINRFSNMHVTLCNIDIDSYISNLNSGENINFDFCVFGSAKIGLKSNGGVTGYWFNNCSLDFLQCVYYCNLNRGLDMVTFRDCWIEGFNANQGGESSAHGLVYGNSYVASSNPHPNRVSFIDCKLVNNSEVASIGSVSDIIIETTDAEILFDNNVLSLASPYDENSYSADKLYGCSDNVNIKVSNFRIALRAQGNKLLHKSQNLLPVHITRLESVDLTSGNANYSYPFGNIRVRGINNIQSADGTSGEYLEVSKVESADSASCIIEPNIDLIDIKHLKDLILFPKVELNGSTVNNVGIHYLIRYYNKDGNLASTSSSFKNFLYSDGSVGNIDDIQDIGAKIPFIPYAVRNYRFVDNTDTPEDAAYFIPCIRIQYTGVGSSNVRFYDFNLIDKKSELVLKPKEYYNSLPTIGSSYIGKNGFIGDKAVIHNGYKWTMYDGKSPVSRYGTTANRPIDVLSTDVGLIYYNSSTYRPEWYTGAVWREADSVIVGTRRWGTTEERPTVSTNAIYAGFVYRDSTLNKTLQHSGSDIWRETNGVLAGTIMYGTTAQRPTASNLLYVGFTYYDTDVKSLLVWTGNGWVSNDGYPAGTNSYGTTANRPTLTSSDIGFKYYDTSINKLIVWTGGIWRETDSVGAGTLRIGTTAQRPTTAANYISGGFQFFDTTLFRSLIWTGSVWRESDGVAAGTLRSGNTASRPTVASNYIYNGFSYFDTSLGKLIFWNGSKWVEGDGATAGVLRVGNTASRPASTDIYIGFRYYDLDLVKYIYYNSGLLWIEGDGVSAGTLRIGTTTERPTGVPVGFLYFDTTITKTISWDGSSWLVPA